MYNNFVIVGPLGDPADLRKGKDASSAFQLIANSHSIFISRGDDSGTHKRELALWQKSGLDPSVASGDWYREVGKGMGATLNAAVAMNAYTLTDRGTWISYRGKRDFKIQYQGGEELYNPYGVILVNSERHPTVKAVQGKAFVKWLISSEGQKAIGSYKINGQQLFFPGAKYTSVGEYAP
jgi:tungstate transport system substrate-binding protein